MLSPWLKPGKLNGGVGSNKITNALYGNDSLDKRNHSAWGTLSSAADTAKDVAETIANALGIRSPYFIIGEIPENVYGWLGTSRQFGWTNYSKGAAGVIRAVASNTTKSWGNRQDGVIIDCLGEVTSDIGVEFTKKPMFYQSNTVIDSRVRKPTTIKATVAVSNHLSDNAADALASQAAALDPTGTLEVARDALFYEGNTRAQYALYKLRNLMENGEPFTVYTPHGYYDNMLIKSLKPHTTDKTMDMLLCDIEYQEAILCAPYMTETDLKNRTPTRTNVTKGDSLASQAGSYLKSKVTSLF